MIINIISFISIKHLYKYNSRNTTHGEGNIKIQLNVPLVMKQ